MVDTSIKTSVSTTHTTCHEGHSDGHVIIKFFLYMYENIRKTIFVYPIRIIRYELQTLIRSLGFCSKNSYTLKSSAIKRPF